MVNDLVRVTDVFGISRDLPMNYVSRPLVDDELVAALTRDKHLVIFGSSKQGKTSVRKYHLHEDEYVVVTCGNRWTLGQLHAFVLKAAGYTVVQSETRSASGTNKISATGRFGFKVLVTVSRVRLLASGRPAANLPLLMHRSNWIRLTSTIL